MTPSEQVMAAIYDGADTARAIGARLGLEDWRTVLDVTAPLARAGLVKLRTLPPPRRYGPGTTFAYDLTREGLSQARELAPVPLPAPVETPPALPTPPPVPLPPPVLDGALF